MSLNLVFKDVMWNLNTISSVDNHQTLLVVGNKLHIDTRLFQFLRRNWNNNNRENIINIINHTLDMENEIIDSYQHSSFKHTQHDTAKEITSNLLDLAKEKNNFVSGLRVLSSFERYDKDAAFQIKINRIVDRVDKLSEKCLVIHKEFCSIRKKSE